MLAFFYMLLLPPFLFSFLFKKNAYRASSVARRFGCCAHPSHLPWPGEGVPCPSPGWLLLQEPLAPITSPKPRCFRAGSKYESSLPHNPREGGLLCGGAFLTPPAAESQQIRAVTGFDCSHVNRAGNSLWHLVSVYFVF